MSGNVPRLEELNNNANEVNCHLVLMYKERNIPFLSNDESIDPSKHLNESKLNLKSKSIKIFAEDYSRFLVQLNWRQQRKTNLNTSISLDLDTDDPKEILKNLKLKTVNRLICAQLNINFMRNKFNTLVHIINNNIDILMISFSYRTVSQS